MNINCRVTPLGLVPLDDYDAEQKAQLRLGSNVRVHITQPRNLAFHRKFFALLGITLSNINEELQRAMRIYSVESLLDALKLHLGLWHTLKVANQSYIKLDSISFANMKQDEFQEFYNRAVDCILRHYLIGLDKETLVAEVEQFISQQ